MNPLPHRSGANLAAAFMGLTPEPESQPPPRHRRSRRSISVEVIDHNIKPDLQEKLYMIEEDSLDVKPCLVDIKPVLADPSLDVAEQDESKPTPPEVCEGEFDDGSSLSDLSSIGEPLDVAEPDESKPTLKKEFEDVTEQNESKPALRNEFEDVAEQNESKPTLQKDLEGDFDDESSLSDLSSLSELLDDIEEGEGNESLESSPRPVSEELEGGPNFASTSSTLSNKDPIGSRKRSNPTRDSSSNGVQSSHRNKRPRARKSARSSASYTPTFDYNDPPWNKYPQGPKSGKECSKTFISKYMRRLAEVDQAKTTDPQYQVIDDAQFTLPVPISSLPQKDIKLSEFQTTADVRARKQDLIDHLVAESKGVIVDSERLLKAFWEYKIDGEIPFACISRNQPKLHEENVRLFQLYLEYNQQHSIMAFPVTKMKINLFFVDTFSHLSESSTGNYVNGLINMLMVTRIMFRDEFAGSFPLIRELKEDNNIWVEFWKERKAFGRHKNGKQAT